MLVVHFGCCADAQRQKHSNVTTCEAPFIVGIPYSQLLCYLENIAKLVPEYVNYGK